MRTFAIIALFLPAGRDICTNRFGETDLLSSVSSNTFSVGDEFVMEEDLLDDLGADDDEAGVGLTLDGINLLNVEA